MAGAFRRTRPGEPGEDTSVRADVGIKGSRAQTGFAAWRVAARLVLLVLAVVAALPAAAVPTSLDGKVTAVWGDQQVTLSWEGVTGKCGGFRYEYEIDDIGVWIDAGRGTSKVVENLINGRQYSFKVRGKNSSCSDEDRERGGTVGLGVHGTVTGVPRHAPSPPFALTATPGDGLVTLEWQTPADDGGSPIVRYEYEVDGSGEWVRVSGGSQARNATVRGLTNGTLYTFKVRAVSGDEVLGGEAQVTATPVGPPSKPRNLRATPGDGQVKLTWSPPEKEDHGGSPILRYEYDVDGSESWEPAAGGDQAVQAIARELNNGQRYVFRVRAVTVASPGDAETIGATPVGPPSAPVDLAAEAGDRKVTLNWEPPESDGGLSILRYEYRVDGSGDWEPVPAAPREKTVTGLTNGQSYGFELRAVNAEGEGEAAPVTATPSETPSEPRNLRATRGNGQVMLAWEQPRFDGGSRIERYEYCVGEYADCVGESGSWTSTGQVREATVTNLTNGEPYEFNVRAVNAQGPGEAATDTATPAETPSAPLSLSAARGDRQVTLNWEPPSDGGSAILRYQYEVDGSGEWVRVSGGPAARSVTVPNLENNRSYEFKVRAVNVRGAGEAATVALDGSPSAPVDLTARAGAGQVTLTWEPPRSDGGSAIERYEYRVDSSGAWVPVDGEADARETTVTELANGQSLVNGLRYRFELRAVNGANPGEGAAAMVTARPSAKPSEPRNLSATPGDRQVTLNWEPPFSDGGSAILRYEYRVDGRGMWTPAVGGADARETTVKALDNGLPYHFELRAVNSAGEGEGEGAVATETATPSEKPSAPHNLRATPGDRQVTLRWEPPSNDGGSDILRYEYRVDGRGVWTRVEGEDEARETTVTGLTNGQSYDFEVRAVNMQGEGAVATETATLSGKPSAPLKLGATPGDAEVTLTWDPPSSDGDSAIEGYELRVDSSGEWMPVDGEADARETTVEGLHNGLRYIFEVRAVNMQGEGAVATVTATPSEKPSAPRNLSATPGDAEVTLRWDAPSSDGGSAIERYEYRVDGSGMWTPVEGEAREETVTGLTNGQSYDFEVRAVNMQGEGAVATETATLSGKPSAPLNLSAAPGDRQVTLTWDPPSSDGYSAIERYEYRVDSSGMWTPVGEAEVRETTVEELDNGLRYRFEVRAVNMQGEGAVATVMATPSAKPSAPRNLSATPGDAEVTLTWDPPSEDGGSAIERYELRADGSGGWIGSGTSRRVTVTRLINRRQYTFEVRAVNAAGEGEVETVTATPVRTPSAPRDLSATPGDRQVTLSWDAPSSDGGSDILRYAYRLGGSGEWTGAGTAQRVTVSGLANGQSYDFEVRAVNAQGEGAVATVTATPVLGPPGAPTGLSATPVGPSEILLSWKAPADNGEAAVTGYRIEVSVDGGSSWGVLVATVNATTYRHTGLYGGTTRRYRVSAVNSSGAGGPSEPEGATTDRGPPAAPRALRAAPGDEEVTLSWDAPSSNGGSAILRYEHRVGGASATWRTVNGGAGARSATVTALANGQDLVNGQGYTFEVRAVNGADPGEGEAATVRAAAGRFDQVTGMWLEGFASTVAGHLLDRVHERLAAPREAGARVSLAGRAMGGGVRSSRADVGSRGEASQWHSPAMGVDVEGRRGVRALTERELLSGGTAFELSGARSAARGGNGTVWGSAAYFGFARGSDGVSVDGGASTAMLGADYASGRWTSGLALAHSRGAGSYTGSGGGEVESSLTALHPYVVHAVTDRFSVWGVGGYGKGTLTLAPARGAAVETDIGLAMAAFGARGTLLSAATHGFDLALETDGLWLQASSDAVSGLASNEVGATRVRLGLEGSQARRFRKRSTLTRGLEVGLRHDGGDAQGGLGVDLGGGLLLRNPAKGLAADLSGRVVLAHAGSDFREWGVSGSVVFDPRPDSRRGLSLSVRPSVGLSASHGVAGLSGWEAAMGGMEADAAGAGDARLEAGIAYGLAVFGGRMVGVPHAGLGLSGAGREYTLGWRLESARPRLGEFGVSMRRREGAGSEPEDRIGLDLTLHW